MGRPLFRRPINYHNDIPYILNAFYLPYNLVALHRGLVPADRWALLAYWVILIPTFFYGLGFMIGETRGFLGGMATAKTIWNSDAFNIAGVQLRGWRHHLSEER